MKLTGPTCDRKAKQRREIREQERGYQTVQVGSELSGGLGRTWRALKTLFNFRPT